MPIYRLVPRLEGAHQQGSYDVKMRRILVFWSGAFVVLILAFVTTVILLNVTVYSASSFARGYVDSLANHDSAAALATPGVRTANDADTSLLANDAIEEITNIEVVDEIVTATGIRSVTVAYTLGSSDARQTEFLVESSGVRFGLFSTWRFVASPLTTVSITVLHDDAFDVNSLAVTSPNGWGEPRSFLVFTPGRYTLEHRGTFLRADPVTVESTTIGEILDATITVRASDEFVAKVQSDLNDFLNRCATQQVLMPTGCPFGLELRNRVEGLPVWSIIDYPDATIIPDDDPANSSTTWTVPDSVGIAHITVDVRSIFDGSVSNLDRDVEFSVGYQVEIRSGNTIVLTPRGY